MRERPILFNGAMVRALIDGSKTQTRRIVKGFALELLQPVNFTPEFVALPENGNSPYGYAGDRLWVREAFAFTDAHEPKFDGSIEYRADNKCFAVEGNSLIDTPHGCDPQPFTGPWSPSIHMPRWASRILLEIVSVRVERLQDISEADARAEGITDGGCVNCGEPEPCDCANPSPDARDAYCHLWGQINGAGSWAANPFVWVIEFKRVTA